LLLHALRARSFGIRIRLKAAQLNTNNQSTFVWRTRAPILKSWARRVSICAERQGWGSPLRSLPSRQRLALSEPVPLRRPRRQQQLIPFLASQLNSRSLVPAEPYSKSSLSGRDAQLSRTKLITSTTLPFKMPDRTSSQKNLSLDELSRLGKLLMPLAASIAAQIAPITLEKA
jgi:hypothetical protein